MLIQPVENVQAPMSWNPKVHAVHNIIDVPPYIYQPSPLIKIKNQTGFIPHDMMEEMMPVSLSPLVVPWSFLLFVNYYSLKIHDICIINKKQKTKNLLRFLLLIKTIVNQYKIKSLLNYFSSQQSMKS